MMENHALLPNPSWHRTCAKNNVDKEGTDLFSEYAQPANLVDGFQPLVIRTLGIEEKIHAIPSDYLPR
jgi:hypothetical protein